MANQIAASVPVQSRAAELTAAHLRNFWAPSMIDELHAMVLRDPDLVTEPVRHALGELRPRAAR
jgi:NADH-dependant formate dehydrogenase delta subunit FdsD